MSELQPLKLAYFVNQYPKGSHTFIRREILALEAMGIEVARFALRGWNDATLVDSADLEERVRTQFVLQEGFLRLTVHSLKYAFLHPVKFARGLHGTFKMARGSNRSSAHHVITLFEAVRLTTWMHKCRTTHVHAHFGNNSAEVVYLARLLGGPKYSLTLHGPLEWDMPMQLNLTEKISRAAFVVGISSFARGQIMRWAPVSGWPTIHQVHCGLDSQFLDGSAQSVPNVSRFVCVARLSREKAQFLLIHALAVLRQRGQRVDLVLVGDGPDRPELEKLIDELDLSSSVTITGWIAGAQVRDEILASRALVSASFAEGLPVAIMEAMALRRPVISTSIAAVGELVRHGCEGWLIPSGSVSAIADALLTCLDTPQSELVAMGERAHERVRARHSANDQASRLLQLFQRHM